MREGVRPLLSLTLIPTKILGFRIKDLGHPYPVTEIGGLR